MALMEVHYSSFAMGTNITLNVFVPTPGSSEAITDMNQSRKYDYEHGLPATGPPGKSLIPFYVNTQIS